MMYGYQRNSKYKLYSLWFDFRIPTNPYSKQHDNKYTIEAVILFRNAMFNRNERLLSCFLNVIYFTQSLATLKHLI